MAEEIVKVIKIQTAEGERSVKSLRKDISDLRDSLLNCEQGGEQWKSIVEQLTVAQSELDAVTKAGKTNMDGAKDSIVGMEAEYRNLYNTYKMLTEEQRNSDFGKNMANSLNDLSIKLNATKQGVGNFTANIGHYSESIMNAFGQMGIPIGALQGPMKLATAASKGLGTALKSLAANPIGAVIMAVVIAFKALSAIVSKVKDAINSNEESQMKLSEAMSLFQPVIDNVNNAFDKLGQTVVKVIGFVADAFAKIREIYSAVFDFLGITKGANQRVKEQNALYKDLAKSQNELTKKKREYQKLNATDKAEVERLKEEASETSNLEDKKRLLEDAKEKQAEIDQRNIDLAKEEVRILQVQRKLTANSAEDNDKLAAALAKVAEAEATAASNARQFNKQLNSTGSGGGGESRYTKEKKAAQELYETLIENNKTELVKLQEKYDKELAMLKKFHKDTTLLTKQFEEEKAKIEKEFAKQSEKLAEEAANTGELSGLEYAAAKLRPIAYELFKTTFGGNVQITEELKARIQDLTGVIVNSGEDIDNLSRIYTKRLTDVNKKIAELKKSSKDALSEAQFNNDIANQRASNPFSVGSYEWKEVNQEIDDAVKQHRIDSLKEQEEAIKDQIAKLSEIAEAGNEDAILQKQELEATLLNITAERINSEIKLSEEKWEREQELNKKKNEAYKAVFELQKKLNWDIHQSAIDNFKSIGDLANGFASLTKAELENGKLGEKQIKKKEKALKALQAVQTAVAIGSIVADTAASIMSVWKGYATELTCNSETAEAAGPAAAFVKPALDAKSLASAIIRTTTLAATGTGQIAAAIGNTISNSSAGSMGDTSGTAPTLIDSNPYSYSRTLQTEEEETKLNRPIWVSVKDINDGLNKTKVTEEESSW